MKLKSNDRSTKNKKKEEKNHKIICQKRIMLKMLALEPKGNEEIEKMNSKRHKEEEKK